MVAQHCFPMQISSSEKQFQTTPGLSDENEESFSKMCPQTASAKTVGNTKELQRYFETSDKNIRTKVVEACSWLDNANPINVFKKNAMRISIGSTTIRRKIISTKLFYISACVILFCAIFQNVSIT